MQWSSVYKFIYNNTYAFKLYNINTLSHDFNCRIFIYYDIFIKKQKYWYNVNALQYKSVNTLNDENGNALKKIKLANNIETVKFNCFSDLTKIQIDLVYKIFDDISIESLISLGSTSKIWKNITNKAPFWISLCQESKIFPIEERSRTAFILAIGQRDEWALLTSAKLLSERLVFPKIELALCDLKMILWKKNLEPVFKLEVEGRLNFLKAKKKHIQAKSNNNFFKACNLYRKVIENKILPIEVQLYASLHKAIIILEEKIDCTPAEKQEEELKFQDIITRSQDLPSQALNREAKYTFARLRVEERINIISLDEAISLLREVAIFKNAAQPRFLLAQLCYENKTKKVTDKEAINFLVNNRDTSLVGQSFLLLVKFIYEGRWILPENKMKKFIVHLLHKDNCLKYGLKIYQEIMFIIVIMCFEKRLDILSDEMIIKQLQFMLTNNQLSNFIKRKADFIHYKMKMDGRTNTITEIQATNILLNIINNPDSINNEDFFLEANFIIAKMRFDNKTALLTDERSSECFKKVYVNKKANDTICLQAKYYRAMLISQERVNDKDYLFAAEVFEKIRTNKDNGPDACFQADYQLAILHAKCLIDTPNFNQTAKTFFDIIQLNNASNEIIGHSYFYLAHLFFNHRTNLINRNQALYLMTEASKNVNLPENIRNQASYWLRQEKGIQIKGWHNYNF